MYEFVKTETGWRVFWGIDPRLPPSATRNHDENDDNDSTTELCLLPFPQAEIDSILSPTA
jgi:hypothetical protein